jgi:2-polyprenyl-3-methyl-5-hydroxy-6-metoxy-1,4-benzoquinol methylase
VSAPGQPSSSGALDAVDRLLERGMAVTARVVGGLGPPPLMALLAEQRRAALDQALQRHRPVAADLDQALEAGDAAAREQLAAIAETALADMRAQLTARARRAGLGRMVASAFDARFHDGDLAEYLDDPALDERLRRRIMASLDGLNEAIAGYQTFLDALTPLVDGGPVRVLDLAAGHGGFALSAAREARARGLDLTFTASDIKREYLDMGAAVARREGLPVEFALQDALDLSNLPRGAYDVVLCTQSLHHSPPGLVAVMFQEAARAAGRGVVFVDGCRSLLTGVFLALCGTLRYRSGGFVHDSWVSARRFFVPEELELLARIGPFGDRVESRWVQPGHCLLRRVSA